MNDTTDFGFQEIPREHKRHAVAEVFERVANRYDLMNDVMSLGWHRAWKCFALELLPIRAGSHVLDLAGGTGDFSLKLHERVGASGQVYLSDINRAMLDAGRDRLLNAGIARGVSVVQADAEQLPFRSSSLDAIIMAFGLRNVTDKPRALSECLRVLKAGGVLQVLEFSKPVTPLLGRIYDLYSFQVIPKLGRWVAGDEASYRYLVESIRRHPDQDTLADMFRTAGFERVSVHNLSGGIVALHRGYRL